MDFFRVQETRSKKDGYLVTPDFLVKPSKDLMIRGGKFYAIWDEAAKLWSTDEYRVVELVDSELQKRAEELREKTDQEISVDYLLSSKTNAWKSYTQYTSLIPDSFYPLNERIIFSNTPTDRNSYASFRLDYPLVEGDISAYDELMGALYDPEERQKLEWAIGSVVCGDSKKLQKFVVLYGSAGSGKSTVLNIIDDLFHPYCVSFDAKALGSSSESFSLEPFRSNPLIALQHDGDLSRIEDNTRLNSIVSHELMKMNEKYRSSYDFTPKAFLFMGTNKPVKITDAKSGILRRLIDVTPSGRHIPEDRYAYLMNMVHYERGAIAYHCLKVYQDLGPYVYSDYKPLSMMMETNSFANFVDEHAVIFEREDQDDGGIPLSQAWALYKEYCNDSSMEFRMPKFKFKEELKNYFGSFSRTKRLKDGKQSWYVYSEFLANKLAPKQNSEGEERVSEMIQYIPTLHLESTKSEIDELYKDFPAQYANEQETPLKKWSDVTTTLKDLDTTKLHYVFFPDEFKNHIVIDFDLKDENGNKSAERNLEEAAKWPATYAEFSKGGAGVHLHYIYDGDASKISAVYSPGIEIKVFNGKSSLRRRLSYCNELPVAHISNGLPLKEEKRVVSFSRIQSEKGLRSMIERNLQKEFHGHTKPSVDFIYSILEDAYNGGMVYDVRDMRPRILAFAANSTNQSDYCVRLVSKMKFCSEKEPEDAGGYSEDKPIVFFDLEVFPNLLIVCWKVAGEGHEVVRMINPKPYEMEFLMKMRLVGFNNRRYDNHIVYARHLGWSNEEIYNLSQRLIKGSANATFREAYNLSYADIYEFSSVKQSLKKFEIELGINHLENSYPWDEPLPEDKWDEVAEYCCNDVLATEATFNARYSDFVAQEILADLTGMPVNSNGNSMAARLIFGSNPEPKLVYTDLATGEPDDPNYKRTDIITAFPGYEFVYDSETKKPKNMFRGTDVGFGGYVYAEPGMYTNVALLDVASLHPHSAIAMNYFGPYTKNFEDLVDARIFIKHKDYDKVRNLFNGRLAKYLEDESKIGDLAYSLKIVINKVYGLSNAKFNNAFRDSRNKNNIIALRGALFMRTLQDEVTSRGFQVVHIKTDSIKIPNATLEIINFCMEFAKKYGYEFEHEATYDRMCLVNNSVYIAKYADVDRCQAMYGYIPDKNKKKANKWTPTGAQFAHPFVFKTLFSKEKVEFDDMRETKEVQGSIYLDYNENLPDVSLFEKELAERRKSGKQKLNSLFTNMTDSDLEAKISEGHFYKFVGRIGQFTPVQAGCGGAELLSKRDTGYASVTATKGYRWLESAVVKRANMQDKVDLSYYRALVDDAIANISQYGDFEWFANSDDPLSEINHPPADNDVPWLMPCHDPNKTICEDCPEFETCQYLIRHDRMGNAS